MPIPVSITSDADQGAELVVFDHAWIRKVTVPQGEFVPRIGDVIEDALLQLLSHRPYQTRPRRLAFDGEAIPWRARAQVSIVRQVRQTVSARALTFRPSILDRSRMELMISRR